MRLRALTAGLLLLAAAGCGGSAQGDTPAGADKAPKPAASAPATPEVDYASVSQYASIVSGRSRDLEAKLTELDDECLWSAPGHVPNNPALIVCDLGPMTVGLQAATLKLELSQAAREGSRTYIGAVPPEIEGLVEDTIATAKDLAKTGRGLDTGCVSEGGPGCLRQLINFDFAADDMQDQLAAWGPYL